jgi:hypothetical protein
MPAQDTKWQKISQDTPDENITDIKISRKI